MDKGVIQSDESIFEDVLWEFSHVERMENDRIAKRVYVEQCASSHSVGRPQKRLTDIVKDCLRKKGLDLRQVRRIGKIGVNGSGL